MEHFPCEAQQERVRDFMKAIKALEVKWKKNPNIFTKHKMKFICAKWNNTDFQIDRRNVKVSGDAKTITLNYKYKFIKGSQLRAPTELPSRKIMTIWGGRKGKSRENSNWKNKKRIGMRERRTITGLKRRGIRNKTEILDEVHKKTAVFISNLKSFFHAFLSSLLIHAFVQPILRVVIILLIASFVLFIILDRHTTYVFAKRQKSRL